VAHNDGVDKQLSLSVVGKENLNKKDKSINHAHVTLCQIPQALSLSDVCEL
jgi:hypothetical protein